MRLVLLHIQCPRFINWKKGAKGPMIFFGGGGIGLRRWGMWPIITSKGGIFPTTNKTLKVHSYHFIFHIKHSSGVHADRNSKDLIYWHTRSKEEAFASRLQVSSRHHAHELMSLVSINCVNNIECYWSR